MVGSRRALRAQILSWILKFMILMTFGKVKYLYEKICLWDNDFHMIPLSHGRIFPHRYFVSSKSGENSYFRPKFLSQDKIFLYRYQKCNYLQTKFFYMDNPIKITRGATVRTDKNDFRASIFVLQDKEKS